MFKNRSSGIANLAGIAILLSYIIIVSGLFSLVIADQLGYEKGYYDIGPIINESVVYDFIGNNFDSTNLGKTSSPKDLSYYTLWDEFLGIGLVSKGIPSSQLFIHHVIPDKNGIVNVTYYINNTIGSEFKIYPNDQSGIGNVYGTVLDFNNNHIKFYEPENFFQSLPLIGFLFGNNSVYVDTDYNYGNSPIINTRISSNNFSVYVNNELVYVNVNPHPLDFKDINHVFCGILTNKEQFVIEKIDVHTFIENDISSVDTMKIMFNLIFTFNYSDVLPTLWNIIFIKLEGFLVIVWGFLALKPIGG
jgi:hypothetical protein